MDDALNAVKESFDVMKSAVTNLGNITTVMNIAIKALETEEIANHQNCIVLQTIGHNIHNENMSDAEFRKFVENCIDAL